MNLSAEGVDPEGGNYTRATLFAHKTPGQMDKEDKFQQLDIQYASDLT